MRSLTPILAILLILSAAVSAQAADWITAPSFYTHDRVGGERVAQYSPIGPFYYYPRPDYLKSGYRHLRSTIQAGGSADNLHIVEEWGRPVRPYEEWRFPYRPFSVPYDQWGPPPFAGWNGGWGGPGWGGPGWGGGGGWGPTPFPGGGGGPPANFAQPWMDGYYPSYDQNDRSDYYQPYVAPRRRP